MAAAWQPHDQSKSAFKEKLEKHGSSQRGIQGTWQLPKRRPRSTAATQQQKDIWAAQQHQGSSQNNPRSMAA
eukprot:scaffold84774_cov18-Tisochrysis_lutea.AAC.1